MPLLNETINKNEDFSEKNPFLSTSKFHWAIIISCSIFFAVFLIVFLPFGVNEPKKEFSLIFIVQLSMFGWIIFFTLLVNEFLFRRKFIHHWTFKVFLIWIFWTFLSSGTMNFLLYNYLQEWYDMSWSSYVLHVVNVSMVQMFPLAGVFFYFRYQVVRQSLNVYGELQETLEILSTPITFKGNSEKERITLELRQILYIESDDNYVVVHFQENRKARKHILRSTLSSIEKTSFPIDFLMRIHRSFIINIYAMEFIRGNAQKSVLKLRNVEKFLPVSRAYIHEVRSQLANI